LHRERGRAHFAPAPVAPTVARHVVPEAAVRQGLRASGRPLDAETRAVVESRFGHDFRHVRVHSEPAAARAAQALRASAFTVGHDVVFDEGRYRPRTTEGLRLLAHELAHVVQQAEAPPRLVAGTVRRPASEWAERESDQAAETVSRGGRLPVSALHATPAGIQCKEASEETRKVEDGHRQVQQRVYRLLEPDTVWDYARRGATSPKSLTPEQRAKDPHVIFNNSVAWIRARRITLSVLTPLPGQPEESKNVTLFDPTVNYPDLGGSVDNTISRERGVEAKLEGPDHIIVVAKPGLTEDKLRELLRHEIQHVADAHSDPDVVKQEKAEFQAEKGASDVHAQMNAQIWNQYQTEFRGHWIGSITRPGFQAGVRDDGTPVEMGGSGGVDRWGSESGPGGELKVSGHESLKGMRPLYVPEASIQLQNEKQTNIARQIVHNYFGMEETFLTSPLFRTKIQALAKPEGVNLVNSIRIERVRLAMHGPATHKSIWLREVPREETVARAVQALDDTDRAFLKDPSAAKPFWDDARRQSSAAFFTWMEDTIIRAKTDPPPLPPPASKE
jgi:hypothetical protein